MLPNSKIKVLCKIKTGIVIKCSTALKTIDLNLVCIVFLNLNCNLQQDKGCPKIEL